MPLEEPAENAPFLWMTLTDDQKKKAENKYFTLKELKRRLRSKERKRKANSLIVRRRHLASGCHQRLKNEEKIETKGFPFLRPITLRHHLKAFLI